MGIVYLFDMIELTRRASDDDVGLGQLLLMALYKAPEVGQQILPFITLFAALATFRSLTERRELVCIRAAGLSAWQFLLPILTTTFFMSLIYITILHPLSAASMERYQVLENLYFGDGTKTISVFEDGLWIRQEDDTGNFILKARDLDVENWVFDDISVFFFDGDNNHIQRVDADEATLKPGEWNFNNVSVHQSNAAPRSMGSLRLGTTMTSRTIIESFSDPETISFWRLPYFIKSIQQTGFDTREIRAYYQGLLVQPLMLVAMILMAAAIGLKTSRTGKLLPIVVLGIGFGFLAFFMSGFLRALALGDEIPLIMGVWAPPIIILLSGATFLAQLEDG
jgi:lipopolysaccharide export system permease protein